ncbi:MAG: hypothetical protein Q9181_008243, partial [Wetmoreana brouardii]
NATLTVAAANADDCSRGFRSDRVRSSSVTDQSTINLPFLCPDWAVGNIFLAGYNDTLKRREPLHCRSWPFQEYLLSPRVLMYGSEQMLWICHQDSPTAIGATFKDGGPAHDSSIETLKYMRMFLSRPQTISRGFARRNLWIDLVMEYSSRKQTIPDDKIHALRGVAAMYQRHMEDEYIAGLWKSWLLPGLMWKRSQSHEIQPHEIQPRRKRQYPSWSWLSIDSAVTMEKARDEVYKPENVFDVQFIKYSPDALGISPSAFGLLPNAVLHLHGHITKVENPDWKAMRLFDKVSTQDQKTKFLHPQPSRIILDALEATDSTSTAGSMNGPVWCMPIIRVKVADQQADTYVGYAVQGLLLLEEPSSNHYTRIGWFISGRGEEAKFLSGKRQD